MSEYEATGRTEEEAVQIALAYLGIKKQNAIIEVRDEPTQGLLGLIGNKCARVVVKPVLEPFKYLELYLQEMLKHMKIDGQVSVKEEAEKIEAHIFGQDVGTLIGRRGRTLNDIQYLLNVIMRRQYALLNKMIVLDIENYRSRREKTIKQLAVNAARKVSREGFEQVLEPMTPQERRIVHIALQDFSGITTYSSGEEPHRKVVIAPS